MSVDVNAEEHTIPSIVSGLAGGISTAAETQNTYWLALALFSVFIIIPRFVAASTNPDTPAHYELPFNLPSVDPKWFSCVSLLVLSGLIVAFSAAESNLVRSQTLARRTIRDIWHRTPEADLQIMYLDELRKPSLTHVSSMTRNYYFYPFFKVMVLVVWIGLPGTALYFAAKRYFVPALTLHAGWSSYVVLVVCALAVATAGASLAIAAGRELAFVLGDESPRRRRVPRLGRKLRLDSDTMTCYVRDITRGEQKPAGLPPDESDAWDALAVEIADLKAKRVIIKSEPQQAPPLVDSPAD